MTTTSISSIFLDTNILLYATNRLSPWYTQATQALQSARTAGIELVISSQVLREYMAVATRPTPGGIGMSVADGLNDYRLFRSQFRLLYEDQFVLDSLDTVLQAHPSMGRQVYDANIAATMIANNISYLLTHNVADFTRFAGLITIIPLVTNTP